MSYGLMLIALLQNPKIYLILIGLLFGVVIYVYTGALLFSFIVLMLVLTIGVILDYYPSWIVVIIIIYFISLIMERYR